MLGTDVALALLSDGFLSLTGQIVDHKGNNGFINHSAVYAK